MDVADLNDLRTRDRVEDLPRIVDLARQHGPGILELGCGTGRVLRALVDAGFDPVGVDTSLDALRVARRKYPHLRLECQRMEQFALDRSFDVVLIPFGGFDQLACLDDRLSTLRRVLDHSRPHTTLYVDIWPVSFAPGAWTSEETPHLLKTIRTDSDEEVQVLFSAIREPLDRRSTCRFVYRVRHTDGSETEHEHIYAVSPITADELRLCLQVSGFRVEGWFGDYSKTPYDPHVHQRLVAEARPALMNGRSMK